MILQFLIAWFATRIHRLQDQVIAYLLEENRILKAKLTDQRLHLTDTERRRLAVFAHAIDRKRLKDMATIATPDTLQRWYRRLQRALAGLGHHIDKITVRNILRRHHIDPAPIRRRTGITWPQFMNIRWDVLTATGFFDAQANPSGLPHPDLSRAGGAEEVARMVLELDRRPRPERSMRWKWQLLGVLSVLAPRTADRILVRRLGGGWQAPRR